ncbi:hypothetical protein [Actinomadura flavalba]|uniref:hypothetical protein n=1 Tax=Actinomadura flavalba TaxID=1120938 RepID=UPI0003A5E662|nr:hypothetical protein [Actinomadura flavalba]
MTAVLPPVYGVLGSALHRRAAQRFDGTLHLDGEPGGTVTMRDGLVVAATTPVSPGPESLLLRSGHVTAEDWTRAFTAGAPDGRLAAELVARGLVGAAGVQVVARAAAADAVFAMALYGVRTCTARPFDGSEPDLVLPAEPGLDGDHLARETVRRLEAADVWAARGLTVRARPVPAPDPPDRPLRPERRELLDRLNGRRTARDLAFTLGRGLFAVLTDLADLARDGFVAHGPPGR